MGISVIYLDRVWNASWRELKGRLPGEDRLRLRLRCVFPKGRLGPASRPLCRRSERKGFIIHRQWGRGQNLAPWDPSDFWLDCSRKRNRKRKGEGKKKTMGQNQESQEGRQTEASNINISSLAQHLFNLNFFFRIGNTAHGTKIKVQRKRPVRSLPPTLEPLPLNFPLQRHVELQKSSYVPPEIFYPLCAYVCMCVCIYYVCVYMFTYTYTYIKKKTHMTNIRKERGDITEPTDINSVIDWIHVSPWNILKS